MPAKKLEKQCGDTFRYQEGKRTACFDSLLDVWLEAARVNVKEATYARYNYLINTYIRRELGRYEIGEITHRLINGHIYYLLNSGRSDGNGGLAPKTVSDILTIIKSVLEFSSYYGFSAGCNLGRMTIRKQDREMRVLSRREQNALTEILLRDPDLPKMGVLICLHTGIRIGELCALKWGDIDIENRTINIRSTMQRIQNIENNGRAADAGADTNAKRKTKIIITEPKSKCSYRKIPVPEYLIKIIEPFRSGEDSFFLTGSAAKYTEPRTMQNHFYSYVREAGIDNANFHALRHTFATRCVELGFEVKSLSEILGHANVNITLNKYVHASFELKARNMDKLSLMAD